MQRPLQPDEVGGSRRAEGLRRDDVVGDFGLGDRLLLDGGQDDRRGEDGSGAARGKGDVDVRRSRGGVDPGGGEDRDRPACHQRVVDRPSDGAEAARRNHRDATWGGRQRAGSRHVQRDEGPRQVPAQDLVLGRAGNEELEVGVAQRVLTLTEQADVEAEGIAQRGPRRDAGELDLGADPPLRLRPGRLLVAHRVRPGAAERGLVRERRGPVAVQGHQRLADLPGIAPREDEVDRVGPVLEVGRGVGPDLERMAADRDADRPPGRVRSGESERRRQRQGRQGQSDGIPHGVSASLED